MKAKRVGAGEWSLGAYFIQKRSLTFVKDGKDVKTYYYNVSSLGENLGEFRTKKEAINFCNN